MKKSVRWGIIAGSTVLVLVGGGLAAGDYVYTSGTAVSCSVNLDDVKNNPEHFWTQSSGNGPFEGPGWDKWVDYDLSQYWMKNVPFEEDIIPVADDINLSAWWITPAFPNGKTVIVTHGINTSRRDYTVLLPTSMLVKEGFNVLLVDRRDEGESTCTDGRHSAGQEESDDFAVVADWLIAEKGITAESLGMFGVSGGAVTTSLVPAKTDKISAFAMEGTVFDFSAAAQHEVEFKGFPGFLWQLALFSAQWFHGVNLTETTVASAIDATGDRPMLVLHGDADQRLAYQSSVDFVDYANSVGVDATLETFKGADHTEGMLTETERYAEALVTFFNENLTP
jgi:dipeptidyl aminopeptidase/acylaminoacyl peptidase